MKHETQMLNVSKTCEVALVVASAAAAVAAVVTHCGLFDDDDAMVAPLVAAAL